jgi:hypothetical protein
LNLKLFSNQLGTRKPEGWSLTVESSRGQRHTVAWDTLHQAAAPWAGFGAQPLCPARNEPERPRRRGDGPEVQTQSYAGTSQRLFAGPPQDT